MPSLLDFPPIFQETADTIRARVNADANDGLAPTDPAFLDTTPGGFFWDISQAVILEIERLWDAISVEMPAAAFPAYAWGTYLDEHGATLSLPRKSPAFAGGTVTFTGTPATVIPANTRVAVPQTDPASEPVEFDVTVGGTIPGGGTVDLVVEAVEAGSAGNVTAGSITTLSSPLAGISAVTNVTPTSGGADVEDDEPYRDRILVAFAGAHGAGTIQDYEGWALAYPGVGFALIEPLWAGPGTVRVTVTDTQNHPVPVGVVTGLQAELDPIPGEGAGLAPVGAIVTVATPVVLTVNVASTPTLLGGYSLDGSAGSVNLTTPITNAVNDYLNRLAPGEDVVLEHVRARFFAVEGVFDVPTLTLNGGSTNIVVDGAHVAEAGTITLT